MNKDFEAITIDLPLEDFKLYCIADVHIGASECDLDGFKKLIKEIQDTPNAYCVICGDLINNATKTSCSDVYKEVLSPYEQVELATELLYPIRDKILGGVSGNHELRSSKDVDIDPFNVIFWQLGIADRCRQNIAFLRLRATDKRILNTVNIVLMHGGSRTKREKFVYSVEGADVFISGHTHDGDVSKPAHIVFTQRGAIKMREIVSVVATSWLKYDEGGYGVRSLYLPKSTSSPQYLYVEVVNANAKPNIKVVW